MSTRYVWGKYNLATSVSGYKTFYHSSGQLNVPVGEFRTASAITVGDVEYTASNGVTFRRATLSGTISKLNPSTTTMDGFVTVTVPQGVYYQSYLDSQGNDRSSFYVTDASRGQELEEAMQLLYEEDGVEIYAQDMMLYSQSAITFFVPNDTEDVFVQTDGTMYFVNAASAVGALAAYVSSSSSETYPTDGISGSYWYTRLTSGSIDPTAVALASSPPVAGQSATIQVTPRSNSYGTISYLYQYSIDDGSTWTTIATSSATSYSFTVPTGAASIKVRVRAQDNLGFTSADYVTSSAYTVTQSTTYAGVSGAVRSVTDYAGVSGAVRSVTTYKGVGGTVRS